EWAASLMAQTVAPDGRPAPPPAPRLIPMIRQPSPRPRWLGGLALLVFCAPLAGEPPAAPSGTVAERKAAVTPLIDHQLGGLIAFSKALHTHPELSLQEERTSARLAKELEALGFTVTTRVGGHGVVGVLKNGPGPTVLVRTDMDALPVVEQTGVPYASTARARDRTGQDVGVMH